MAYPQIPPEIAQELDSLRVAAAAAFQRQDWATAVRRFNEAYTFLVARQKEIGLRLHKGWELYNGGIALIRTGERNDGIVMILLAYTEDVLSTSPGEEDSSDTQPSRMGFIGVSGADEVLDAIKAAAIERKEAGPPCFDPAEVYNAALAQLGHGGEGVDALALDATTSEPSSGQDPARKIEDLINTPRNRRCFVGGAYYFGGPNLEEIREAVDSGGFDPVVALDFGIEDGGVHHDSLLLLNLCTRAIFEVTVPAGHYMELERCRDYDVRPLLVRNVVRRSSGQVSAMVQTMAGLEVRAYTTSRELHEIVLSYLSVDEHIQGG